MQIESIYSAQSVAEVLEIEIQKRKARRPSYSASAFARDLGFSSARMSSILKGRFGISSRVAGEIADRLRMGEDEKQFFIDLTMSQHARRPIDRERAALRIETLKQRKNIEELSENRCELFRTWHNPAVLEIINISNGQISRERIAKRLGISLAEVSTAIETLISLGELKRVTGRLPRNSRVVKTDKPIPKAVIREFHNQVLKLAESALQTVPTEKRKNLSAILSFQKEKLPAAREKLSRFIEEFVNEFSSSQECDSVFAINLNLFRLDGEQK